MKAKKLLALLLSALLLVCLLPLSAAAEGDEVTVIDLSTIKVDSVLSGCSITVKNDGTFEIALSEGRFAITGTFNQSEYPYLYIKVGSGSEICDFTASSLIDIMIYSNGVISDGVYQNSYPGASIHVGNYWGGTISGGTFYADVVNKEGTAELKGGIYFGSVSASDDSCITGGIYYGAVKAVPNSMGLIKGGIFKLVPTAYGNPYDNIYSFTVENGCVTGTEDFEAPLTKAWSIEGYNVPITADEPAEGMAFDCWTGEGVTFTDAYSASTTFAMTDEEVTVAANYVSASIPGDIDGDGKVAMTDAVELIGAIINGKKDDKYDYNGDGRVNYRDAVDYITWLCENYPEIAPLDYFDMNGNGKIDAIDILMIIFSFRSWCGAIN